MEFKFLTSFLNVYKDKLMLNMKEEDMSEIPTVQEMQKATAHKENVDIKLDFKNY